jgi:peptidyl-prolyl cis-trans isomerase D
MLQNFRDGIGKYGKWLMILIAIPFALFGVESFFFRGASVEEAASVNGERITRLEVQQAIQRQRAQIMSRFAEMDPATIDDKLLYDPSLQNLIATRVYADRARSEGMGIAPALIADVLKSAQIFWEDGKFSKTRYFAYLGQMGYTPQTHSRFLARELLASQLIRGVASTGFTNKPLLERALGDIEQTRDARYFTIPLLESGAQTSIDDAAMQAYYEAHPELYISPEHVVVNYVELAVDQIAAEVTVDDSELKSRYERRVQTAEEAKQIIVSQILVKTRPDGSHDKILRELQATLAAGADFSELARTKSEDPLTAGQGGEIGPYTPDKFPLSLRTAVDALSAGQVSSPIETEMGWHLVTIREDKPAIGSFDAERDEIVAELRLEKARNLFVSDTERLREAAYTSENLAGVAAAMTLQLHTSSAITREGGEGIGSDSKVVNAAFTEEVLKGGYASPLIELGDERVIVLERKEHTPERRRAFAEVKADIEKVLTTERVLALARERAEGYRKRLLAGESMEMLARSENLEWQENSGLKRYESTADSNLVKHVFEVSQKSTLPFIGIFANESSVVVFQVVAISPGDVGALPQQRRQQLERALLESVARGELNSYQETLLAGAKIIAAPPPMLEEPQ